MRRGGDQEAGAGLAVGGEVDPQRARGADLAVGREVVRDGPGGTQTVLLAGQRTLGRRRRHVVGVPVTVRRQVAGGVGQPRRVAVLVPEVERRGQVAGDGTAPGEMLGSATPKRRSMNWMIDVWSKVWEQT